MAGRLIAMGAALLLPAAGWAQLVDPTRPPVEAATPVEGAPTAEAPKLTGLQSIILRKSGKPAALVNGAVVELGGMVGEARVVKILEDAVVLKGPGGEEILRLTPAAEKKVKKVGADKTAKSRRDKPPGKKEVSR